MIISCGKDGTSRHARQTEEFAGAISMAQHTGVNGFVCSNTEEYVKAIQSAKTENVNHLVEAAYQEIVDTYNTKNMANEY